MGSRETFPQKRTFKRHACCLPRLPPLPLASSPASLPPWLTPAARCPPRARIGNRPLCVG